MNALFFCPRRRQSPFRRPGTRTGFSLVEVVLSLAVATFALLTIVALLPAGIQSSHTSLDESDALNVLSQLVADRKATPLAYASSNYDLPALTLAMAATSTNFGITPGNIPTGSLGGARFRVDCSFYPPATKTGNPYIGYFKVSWPASAAPANGSVEAVVSFPQP